MWGLNSGEKGWLFLGKPPFKDFYEIQKECADVFAQMKEGVKDGFDKKGNELHRCSIKGLLCTSPLSYCEALS